jgi:hypothetical protein
MKSPPYFRQNDLMKVLLFALALACETLAAGLDFETYRTRVEPVFLNKRPGHARCVACHDSNGSAFRLVPLSPGATVWTEEQSRRNFEYVSRLVVPGNPAASKLLMHPLAPAAGGDYFHGGGRQFASQEDPEWKAIASWIEASR